MHRLENVLDKTYIDLGVYGSSLETLYESFALTIYRNKLKSTYWNATENRVDELFDNY